ncbi:MAG: T9SS type A sorting domain-containing protein, partial [Bacteroidia bacterium]|nr:T9SS type A sorting domain-containing protein [Bacteroidia bacterium]
GTGVGTITVNGTLTVQQGELRLNNNGDLILVNGNTVITGNTSRLEFTGLGVANLNNLTFSNSAGIGVTSTVTGTVNTNNFTVSGSGTMQLSRCNFTATGSTTVNAALNLNSNVGAKSFDGLVTINPTGSWNSTTITTASNLTFKNSIVNNNIFTANSATFNTNHQSLSGNAFDFSGYIVVTGVNITNQTTVHHTSTASGGLTGTGTWIQADNSVYNTQVASITITAMQANANQNVVNYNRNNTQVIFHPVNGEYFHLILSNTSAKTASTGTKIILGNITISGTAQLNIAVNNVDFEIRGNWNVTSTNADVLIEGTRTVTFNGNTQQTISNTGNQSGTDFYNLVINNSSTTGVVLAGTAGNHTRIMANGTLTLTNGYVYTTSDNMIVVLNNGNSTGGNNNSFVTGPIRKIGNQAFVFPTGQDVAPVGKGPEDVWARIGISAPANNTTQFTAQYFFISYGDLTKDATLTHVSFHEYWTLDRAVTTNAVQVTLYYESATRSHINDYTSGDLVVARYTAGNVWTSEGQAARSNSDPGWVRSNVVMNFSPFTFGSISGGNPFPVEFLHFSANALNDKVKLSWTTASEINTSYFQVEKSTDGSQFEPVFSRNAAGFSNSRVDYEGYDFNPLPGTSYYRLKMVDHDGKYSYSNIVAVNFQSTQEITVFPNPVSENLTIQLPKFNENSIVTVYDNIGKMIFSQQYPNTSVIQMNTQTWATGIYILTVKTEQEEFTEKIVKQ